jgi:hypothetical protein
MNRGGKGREQAPAPGPRDCLRTRQAPADCQTCGTAQVTIRHTPMRLPGSHCLKCCPCCAGARVPSTGPGSGGAPGKPIQVDLDCSSKTTRLMSWSERKTAALEWRGGVVLAKADA